MPFIMGSISPSVALAAMAASMALPPRSRIWMPAIDASGWLVATIPYVVATTERPTTGCAGATGAPCAPAGSAATGIPAATIATTARWRIQTRAMLWRDCSTRPRVGWRSYMGLCRRMVAAWRRPLDAGQPAIVRPAPILCRHSRGVEYAGEKLRHPPFRVIERTPRRTHHEPDVAAARHELQCERGHARGDRADLAEHVRRQKRIIDGAQQQRGHTDRREIAERTRSGVVVIGAPESVDRSRHRVVELIDRPRPRQAARIREIGVLLELRERLAIERAKEARLVDTRKSLSDVPGAPRQIERNGHRGGATHLRGNIPAALPEPFEQHVAAQRKSREHQGSVLELADEVIGDKGQIAGFTGVVEPPRAVERAGA